MEEKKLLEVGDVVYCYHKYGKGVNMFIVERVTNTQAILKDSATRLRREIKGYYGFDKRLYCDALGSYENYYLETDDLKRQI